MALGPLWGESKGDLAIVSECALLGVGVGREVRREVGTCVQTELPEPFEVSLPSSYDGSEKATEKCLLPPTSAFVSYIYSVSAQNKPC